MAERTCSAGTCDRVRQTHGYCTAHYARFVRTGDVQANLPLRTAGREPEMFWRKVEKSTDCWLWQGRIDSDGYGRFFGGGAHRWAYRQMVGEVPECLELDHLCRVRHCVNPAHLEPVTTAENQHRGMRATATHCKHGHIFDVANTYWRPTGQRACRACIRERARRYSARQRRRTA